MKNKMIVLACAGMMAFGVAGAPLQSANAAASGPFADVPADHWAYQSVDTLQKAGIVIGYPDGTYGGRRAMTRYEFAEAIARLLPLLNNTGGNYATKDDLAALRSDLEKKLQANSDAIDALRKLVDEFQPELQKLGQDVAAVKTRLDALEARVAAVEEEQRRLKFTGALSLIARGDSITTDSGEFRDQNGAVIFPESNFSVSNPGPTHTVNYQQHLLAQSDVYHDFVLGIRGKLTDTATANVKLDFGNYLSQLGNTAAGTFYSAGTFGEFTDLDSQGAIIPGELESANEQTTLWEANVEAPISLGPLGGADLVAGRFGNQWTKYTLKQIDADVYTELEQVDSGNITTDGAKVNLTLGRAKINAYAGKFSAIPFSQPWGGSDAFANEVATAQAKSHVVFNGQFRPSGLIFANHSTDLLQGAGLRASFGNPDNGVLGVSLQQFGLDGSLSDPNSGKAFDRLTVYGADYNGKVPFVNVGGITLDTSWTVSAHAFDQDFNGVGHNWQYQQTDDQIAFRVGGFDLKGGYQYVGPYFSAPGYWGKVGAWTNPTNIEGPVASAKYVFSPKFSANADWEGYQAAYAGTSSPLKRGDKLTRYQVGVGYGLGKHYDLGVSYEGVEWDLKNNENTLARAGKPKEEYTTFSIGHDLNANTSFRFIYQILHYNDKQTFFDDNSGANEGGQVAEGQFSIKF